MTHDLVPIAELQGELALQNEKAFEQGTKKDYLPRFALMQDMSKAVKAKKIKSGQLAVDYGKDVITDLGTETGIVVLAFRMKAATTAKPYISVFDPSDPEYIRIRDKQKAKIRNFVEGPEFLIWVPAAGTFATLHMNNPTLKNLAPSIKPPKQGCAFSVVLTSEEIDNGTDQWYGMSAEPSSVAFDFPLGEELAEVVKAFMNPKKSKLETDPNAGPVQGGRET